MADVDLTPTAEMARNAARGLELRREHGRGGTAVGVARARDISNGKGLSPETVRRMHAFFSRHAKNKAGGEDDAGYIAWMLWGGDEGRDWASRKVDALDRKERNAMSDTRKAIMERLGMAAEGEKEKMGKYVVSLKSQRTGNTIEFPVTAISEAEAKNYANAVYGDAWKVMSVVVKSSRPGAKAKMGRSDEQMISRLESELQELGYRPSNEPGLAERMNAIRREIKLLKQSVRASRPGAKARFDDNCGTGAGGFKPGNTCGAGTGAGGQAPSKGAPKGKAAPERARPIAGGNIRPKSDTLREEKRVPMNAGMTPSQESRMRKAVVQQVNRWNAEMRKGGVYGLPWGSMSDTSKGMIVSPGGTKAITDAIVELKKTGPDVGKARDMIAKVAAQYVRGIDGYNKPEERRQLMRDFLYEFDSILSDKAYHRRPGRPARFGFLDRIGRAATALTARPADTTAPDYASQVEEAKKAAISEVNGYRFLRDKVVARQQAMDAYVKQAAAAIAKSRVAPDIRHFTDQIRTAVKAQQMMLFAVKTPFGRKGAKAKMGRGQVISVVQQFLAGVPAGATRDALQKALIDYADNSAAERRMQAEGNKADARRFNHEAGRANEVAVASWLRLGGSAKMSDLRQVLQTLGTMSFARKGAKARAAKPERKAKNCNVDAKPLAYAKGDLEREDVKAGLKLMSASDPAVSDKIRTLIKEGKPQEQAVAIALDMKRRGEL